MRVQNESMLYIKKELVILLYLQIALKGATNPKFSILSCLYKFEYLILLAEL